VTDNNGEVVKYLCYLPCSEDYKKQHCNSNASVHFATPFPTVNCQLSTVNWTHTFSAKEKDSETGLSYFGSRYYSSDLSIWLSVDPMSDKYPSLSSYTYCANNPIKLVDPNGEEMTKFEDANGNLIKQIDDGSNAVFQQVGTGRGLHYEFSGFDESQGGVNEVNLGTAIQEQQQMNMDNTELQQSADGSIHKITKR
jgi:RHS repeat-associated protein